MKAYNLILASGSKYRQSLLTKLNLKFISAIPAIDETPLAHETPKETSRRLSRSKAEALQNQFPDHLIIGSDQIAVIDTCQLGKPGNRSNAINQLRMASGRFVTFFTSVSVLHSRTGQIITETDCALAFFKKLTNEQIENYVDIDCPYDCAGGFKLEGLGIALLEKIQGDDPNALVGLPLIKLLGILERYGIRVI